jgi:sec-independent protein translocase protein TatB
MFEFDAAKLFVIGIVALIVIGPKDLPRLLRQIGQVVGKMRRMASEFQGQFMDAMREADLDDLKKDMAKVADAAKIDGGSNRLNQMAEDINRKLAHDPVREAAERMQAREQDGNLEFAGEPTEVKSFVPPLPPDAPPVDPAAFGAAPATPDAASVSTATPPAPEAANLVALGVAPAAPEPRPAAGQNKGGAA